MKVAGKMSCSTYLNEEDVRDILDLDPLLLIDDTNVAKDDDVTYFHPMET